MHVKIPNFSLSAKELKKKNKVVRYILQKQSKYKVISNFNLTFLKLGWHLFFFQERCICLDLFVDSDSLLNPISRANSVAVIGMKR